MARIVNEDDGDQNNQPTDARYVMALEAGRMGTWTWDPVTDVVHWDEAMEARYGLAPGEFGGTFADYLACIHPDERDWVAQIVGEARDNGRPLTFEHRAIFPDGSVHWLEARGSDLRDESGTLIGMVGIGIDIDDRKELERAREEAITLRATAGLVNQLEEAERIARQGSWYWDAESDAVTLSTEMVRLCGATERRMPGDVFARMLLRGVAPRDTERLRRLLARARADRLPRRLESKLVLDPDVELDVLHHVEVLAGEEHGKIIALRGTMQDITVERRAQEQLLEARHLLERERRAVQVLQESLIRPEFPAVDGYSISGRYLAAPNEPEIGGDWYDAFETPDGLVMLAVGDVSGHGIRAARLMAKLRHATRAYACLDPDPQAILTRLDFFLSHFSNDEEFATIVLGLLEPSTGHMTLAAAGHLPPLLLGPDGPSYVSMPQSTVAGLGLFSSERRAWELQLEPGSALIFYTDGLIERRASNIELDLARLVEAVSGPVPEDADVLRDVIFEACLQDDPGQDDVCVLLILRT